MLHHVPAPAGVVGPLPGRPPIFPRLTGAAPPSLLLDAAHGRAGVSRPDPSQQGHPRTPGNTTPANIT
ncbi:hypothetical protein [Micromonospora sp. NBRC 101691]|uniref:hypothetical protein n=1 Tax=Micromonospora sp. NBRC 101691 TaxID=3032198 RepID=UPI002555430C|nr:hypothetical protein [Micromonospora sp. NBRC 101691]